MWIADLYWRGQTVFLSSAWGNWASVYENSAFDMHLPVFYRQVFPGLEKGMRLRYGQLRIAHPSAIETMETLFLPHLWCVGASGTSEKSYYIQ